VALNVTVVLLVPPAFNLRLASVRTAERPADGLGTNETIPAKPFVLVTVIVEVPVVPALSGPTVVGLALIVKSGITTTAMVTTNEAERIIVPSVPVTVTL
jgi:hypothetical protein